MFGFIIGFACLYGLYRLRRGPRHWGRRHGRRRGGWLRAMFESLDTSPGQERAIRAAVDEFLDVAHGLKPELRRSRGDVSKLFRHDAFDEVMLGELFARQDDSITEVRKAFVGLVAKVHEALDGAQRQQLARWLDRRRGFHPYRAAAL